MTGDASQQRRLRMLDAAVSRAVVAHPDGGSWDAPLMAIPAKPAVVELIAADNTTLMLATTADARQFGRARLTTEASTGDAAPAVATGSRVDYRAITASIRAVPVDSAFEADLVYLGLARDRLPAAYATLMARWRPWFVHVDPDETFPELQKTNLVGVMPARSASARRRPAGVETDLLRHGTLIGPFQDKDASGRYIEALIDAGDLCRYPGTLREAPDGKACAYKEMGRCPAPCDGTEPLASYRSRVGNTIRLACSGASTRDRVFADEMKRAAVEQNFERAGELKKTLGRYAALEKGAFAFATSLDEMRWIVASPSSKVGWMRVTVIKGGTTNQIVDLNLEGSGFADEAAAVVRSVQTGSVVFEGSVDELETMAVVSRWLFAPKAKRRVLVIEAGPRISDEVVIESLKKRARSALMKAVEDAGDGIEEQEMGS